MKQLFRCEYCQDIGTEEEIKKHEEECIYNYNKKSCWTCKHAKRSWITTVECTVGQEIPQGKYIERCSKYEWDEKDHSKPSAKDIFGDNAFGGLF